MDALITSPAVLLHHDGELADVRAILDELDAHYVERLGPAPQEPQQDPFDVVIASPRRLLQFERSRSTSTPTLIAVLEAESKTLRSHLRRMSVDLMVRRPVHPAALRLLILHTLYRGPERRHRERVAIGAEIRIRSGLLPHKATLADLSIRGCRVFYRKFVPRGEKLKLILPALVTRSSALKLTGEVLRSGPAGPSEPGMSVLGLRFNNVSPALRGTLQSILDAPGSRC